MNFTTVLAGQKSMAQESFDCEKKLSRIESHTRPSVSHQNIRRNSPCTSLHKRSSRKEHKTHRDTPSITHQQWFDELNAHPNATMFSSAEFDSPHFLQSNQSSAQSDQGCIDGNDSSVAAIRNYRSIIDDLTIENRDLKEKLRWHQNKTINKLDKDKLFELRIHDLPLGKRRELKETLSSFVYSFSDVDNEKDEPEPSFSHHKPTMETIAGSAPNQSSSTGTLHSLMQDFSHASANTSNNPTTIDLDSRSPKEAIITSQGTDKLIGPQPDQNAQYPQYPEGNLPKYASKYMTRTQKMKLVVQRLEQLYTGKTNLNVQVNSKGSPKSEVSNSAKCDIKPSADAKGFVGDREARMEKESIGSRNSAPLPTFSSPGETSDQLDHPSTSDENQSESSNSDQRPTRSFDLDPDRSQIPAENMQYIRHLGLSPTMVGTSDSTNPVVESNGWVYLNLLTNMAQLHIINVTAEFVRAAVLQMSKNFEISTNGQMIRWKGDKKETNLSSEGSNGSKISPLSPSNSKEATNHNINSELEIKPEIKEPVPSIRRRNNFHYVPLFNHEHRSGTTTETTSSQPDSDLMDCDSYIPAPHAHNWRSKKHILSGEEPPINDGAIIFYNRARFYIDLCGDRDIARFPFPSPSSESETSSSHGKECKALDLQRSDSGSFLFNRPFKQPPEHAMSDDCEDLSSVSQNRPDTEASSREPTPGIQPEREFHISSSLQPLKASGIGGTQPADNFEMHVLTRRFSVIPTKLFKTRSPKIKRINRPISKNSLNLFNNNLDDRPNSAQSIPDRPSSSEDNADPVQIVVISTKMIPLPPSQLPFPPGIMSPPESEINSETTSSFFNP